VTWFNRKRIFAVVFQVCKRYDYWLTHLHTHAWRFIVEYYFFNSFFHHDFASWHCILRIHCGVYIINTFLAAYCMCRWVSGLFNCKSRLIKFFHHFMWLKITGGLHFLFLYIIERHRWRSVFPWLRFVHQTLHRLSSFFPMICT